MIWVGIAVLSMLALLPTVWVAWRGLRLRGRQESAIALYYGQLQELDRDLVEARILPPEHGTALLEVQRRLLAAGEAPDASTARAQRAPVIGVLLLVPVAAVALYLVNGRPRLPAEPLRTRMVAAEQRTQDDQAMIDQLKAKIATLDPKSDMAWRGYRLLGQVEAQRHNMGQAADAWRHALAIHFDPTTALYVAEATTETEGTVSPASAELFRKALAAAPPNARWRPMVEKRLSEVGKPLPPITAPPMR